MDENVRKRKTLGWDVLTMIEVLVEYLDQKIAPRAVAGNLLLILQLHGAPVSTELMDAVLGAETKTALSLTSALRSTNWMTQETDKHEDK